MARRKTWDELSPGYRTRLERSGINAKSHAEGKSLRKARGHAHTPEHPSEGVKNPQRYTDWFQLRQRYLNIVIQRKREFFKDNPRFNRKRAEQYVRQGLDGNSPPSIRELRWAAGASESEWIGVIQEDSDTYSFLFYH